MRAIVYIWERKVAHLPSHNNWQNYFLPKDQVIFIKGSGKTQKWVIAIEFEKDIPRKKFWRCILITKATFCMMQLGIGAAAKHTLKNQKILQAEEAAVLIGMPKSKALQSTSQP